MKNRVPRKLGRGKKLLLASAALAALLGPGAMGFLNPGATKAQSQAETADAKMPALQDVSVTPAKSAPSDIPTSFVHKENGYLIFTVTNSSLRSLISAAYGVLPFQVSGGPEWVTTERYDLAAKTPDSGTVSFVQVRSAQQRLLTERFELKLHREAKVQPIYELVVASGGPKLAEAPSSSRDADTHLFGKAGEFSAQRMTMPGLARTLAGEAGRLVIDKTGLHGKYDFVLDWSEGSADSFSTALTQQLGLELRPASGPVEMLVIDQAERPAGAMGTAARE